MEPDASCESQSFNSSSTPSNLCPQALPKTATSFVIDIDQMVFNSDPTVTVINNRSFFVKSISSTTVADRATSRAEQVPHCEYSPRNMSSASLSSASHLAARSCNKSTVSKCHRNGTVIARASSPAGLQQGESQTLEDLKKTDVSFVEELDCPDCSDLANPDQHHMAYSGLDDDVLLIPTDADVPISAQSDVNECAPNEPVDTNLEQIANSTLFNVRNHFEASEKICLDQQAEQISSDALHLTILRKIVIKYFLCRTKRFIRTVKNDIQLTKEKVHRNKIAKKSDKK